MRKILRKLEKNYEIPKKKLEKACENFMLNLGEVSRKPVEFENEQVFNNLSANQAVQQLILSKMLIIKCWKLF